MATITKIVTEGTKIDQVYEKWDEVTEGRFSKRGKA